MHIPTQADRDIAPMLYRDHGGLDTTTRPEAILPPGWMCTPCRTQWIAWRDYRPYIPIQLITIGDPIPVETKRREQIAEQRTVIAAICHTRHTTPAPAHRLAARSRTVVDVPAPLFEMESA